MGLEERKPGIVACDQTRFKQACSFTERLARIMSYCLLSFCSNDAGQNKRMYSLACVFIYGLQTILLSRGKDNILFQHYTIHFFSVGLSCTIIA